MNKKFRIYSLLIPILALLSLVWACREDDEFSKDYDIQWPLPTISSVDPADQALIGSEITLNGSGLDKVLSVVIDGKNCVITDTTPTALKVRLPRRFAASQVTVTNLYRQSVVSEMKVSPEYPTIIVEAFPSEIELDQLFTIEGQNVDLITSVKVGDATISVSSTSESSLTVPTSSLGFKEGDKVVLEVKSALTDVINSKSVEIEIVPKKDYFTPEPSITVFDFEDGTDPYGSGDITTTHGINIGGLDKAGRGEKYFTLKVDNVPSAWSTWLGQLSKGNFDVSKFHKPYLSFLVNTNGNEGYFQLAVAQGGIKAGQDFTAATTGVQSDDYKFKTNGWEWRTISLEGNYSDWGQGSLQFDKSKIIEEIGLSFKQGNGANPFEIHLDQVMITDGPVVPLLQLFDFENGTDPWENNTGATHGVSIGSVPAISGKYYTVQKSGVSNWDWTGAIAVYSSIDLSKAKDPHLNVWVNTNGKMGMLQVETTQNDVKWGTSVDTKNYFLETGSDWKLYSWRLSELKFDNWGGSGTAVKLDITQPIDYLKFGFSTGNVSGEYEINIDQVYISDGPMF